VVFVVFGWFLDELSCHGKRALLDGHRPEAGEKLEAGEEVKGVKSKKSVKGFLAKSLRRWKK